MLEDINRQLLFHEMHRSIEESATSFARQLMSGEVEILYPPNGGFTPAEIVALKDIPRGPILESALRKIFADAAAYPMFHLLNLADGTAAPELDEVQEGDDTAEGMLHDDFYQSYWAWRQRRPDPGWRLDTYEGQPP